MTAVKLFLRGVAGMLKGFQRPLIGPKMQIGIVMLEGCRCRCGHEWLPRDKDDKPRVCPKCKSANWDRPKKFQRK
jgi:hypothetical protein